ncbi:MAG: tetratricopeptide repeat protein, partial [Anaerolineae bacterium]
TELARAYLLIHPQDPLTLYYRTEALLATGYTEEAMNLLLMRMDEESSAVLWYTLARAYLEYGAEEEALIALETALRGHTRGDDTLLLASDDPLHDLSKLLGEIYLETGRCEEAVMRLELLVTPYPDLADLVEEAHRCPTPAPTVTPWLPQDWATGP